MYLKGGGGVDTYSRGYKQKWKPIKQQKEQSRREAGDMKLIP